MVTPPVASASTLSMLEYLSRTAHGIGYFRGELWKHKTDVLPTSTNKYASSNGVSPPTSGFAFRLKEDELAVLVFCYS